MKTDPYPLASTQPSTRKAVALWPNSSERIEFLDLTRSASRTTPSGCCRHLIVIASLALVSMTFLGGWFVSKKRIVGKVQDQLEEDQFKIVINTNGGIWNSVAIE